MREQSAINSTLPMNAISHDLDARLDELEVALKRHSHARRLQADLVQRVRAEKSLLDKRLSEELAEYDSSFLASARELERRVATLEERLESLERTARMPAAVRRLETEADELAGREESLRRQILAEKDTLTEADRNVRAIEEAFLDALKAVGVPGVAQDDVVYINRQTWTPYVFPDGDEAQRWNFFNAGSGGKKTLFNICYALSVHRVAAERHLPLPTFLIIDSPMKNISEDVNEDLFHGFYRYLYFLAHGALSDTQFIIIDNEFTQPEAQNIEIIERYMTRDNPNHPPLISYYRGP